MLNNFVAALSALGSLIIIFPIVILVLAILALVWLHNCSLNSYRTYIILEKLAEKNNMKLEPEELSIPERTVTSSGSFDKHLLDARKYYEQNKFEDAAKEYKMALNMSPRSAETAFEFGNTLFQLDRLNEAKNYYEYAVGLKPNESSYHYNFGTLLSELNKLNEAENEFKIALRLNPNDKETKSALDKVLELKNKKI